MAIGKSKVTTTQEQRTLQSGCTTTSTERCAHRTAHFIQPGIPQLAYISAPTVGCGLFTAPWLIRRNKNSPWQPKRRGDTCSEKMTQKRANYKQSIRRTKQTWGQFRSSKERRPRDASPVSVVVGVDRGQVSLSRFTQLPLLLPLPAAAAMRGTICAEVWYPAGVTDAVVGSSRTNLRTRKHVDFFSMSPR